MSGVAVVAIVLAGYALLCAFFPIGKHMRCHGTGRIYQPFSRQTKWRTCGGCDGRGQHVRLGRRVFGWFIGPYQ